MMVIAGRSTILRDEDAVEDWNYVYSNCYGPSCYGSPWQHRWEADRYQHQKYKRLYRIKITPKRYAS